MIPHSHDDAGFLKTVDTYYTDQVKYILNSVINEVAINSTRKFTYAEVSFLKRWWDEASEGMKNRLTDMVQNGQMMFSMGQWTMPDEAVTHYEDLITNGELGLRWLEETFGECGKPLAGWQIDPFGHSRAVKNLFEKFGYDALFLGRDDQYDFEVRKNSSNLESSSTTIRIALDTVENSGAFCGNLSWFRKMRTLERLEVLVKND